MKNASVVKFKLKKDFFFLISKSIHTSETIVGKVWRARKQSIDARRTVYGHRIWKYSAFFVLQSSSAQSKSVKIKI